MWLKESIGLLAGALLASVGETIIAAPPIASTPGQSHPTQTQPATPAITANFDEDAAGKLPAGWKAEATHQKGPMATWEVSSDLTAPSGPNVLALSKTNHDSADTFNLCWTDKVRFKEGAIELSFKPISGKEDQGGGPVWRAKDSNNYYICRANPLEGNFRVYSVKDGVRKQLASATVEIKAGEWHTIKILHVGNDIECSLDGKKLLEVSDSTLPDEGGVGFWTKADAVTSFDNLTVTPGTFEIHHDEHGKPPGKKDADGDDDGH